MKTPLEAEVALRQQANHFADVTKHLSYSTPAREYAKGMGEAVADRTINRKVPKMYSEVVVREFVSSKMEDPTTAVLGWLKRHNLLADTNDDGSPIYSVADSSEDSESYSIMVRVAGELVSETWSQVAQRVATGNALLVAHHYPHTSPYDLDFEFNRMNHHLRQASILMSGRHLQHGDATQPLRNMEVFTNCSSSAFSSLLFYLLLNGSGVGRAYNDELMLIDWRNMPVVVPVIDYSHADVVSGEIKSPTTRFDAQHMYHADRVEIFEVPDTREGWAKAVEVIEYMSFEGKHRDTILLIDFSKVRPRGSPIAGMQNRPASGPAPLMEAISKVAQIRNTQMPRWRQTMFIDHYLAECVLVGGARRAARMATKSWYDPTVLDFIKIKEMGHLWSSNNSVTVDQTFWKLAKSQECPEGEDYDLWGHAQRVFLAISHHSYYDNSGEPGTINVDKLTIKQDGFSGYSDGEYAASHLYELEQRTKELAKALAKVVENMDYPMIVNPCGEIALLVLGAYCTIADVVPFHAQSIDDAADAFRTATRALIRTNLMRSMYQREVKRTNRIGVGITGFHEFAWKFFGLGFRDLLDEEKSKDFWNTIAHFAREVDLEAEEYSRRLGVKMPHTTRTIKPAGTTSKLFGLTEGAHLASMREFLRWVQFRNDDPLVEEYRQLGYPVRQLKVYKGTTIVGFPTQPEICKLGMGDKLVTAPEATPEEQYRYLQLLEKYWIVGVDAGGSPLNSNTGNQVSYTLKYDKSVVDFPTFKRTLLEGQSSIRCCSVLPVSDTSAYEYLPEQPVSKAEFEQVSRAILEKPSVQEDVGFEHVDCGTGACPVDFKR